ncbi:hypothetical protein EYF80_050934 [Liparis tanakae]|uniref:Uncharacterized protein n=1 Tax=Liparis tanakae TaxID=230148 RepID=A0A4Z2FDQ2_9TELE|nr:hypothetical protein EYF80_050934 [Liparis tanakae]
MEVRWGAKVEAEEDGRESCDAFAAIAAREFTQNEGSPDLELGAGGEVGGELLDERQQHGLAEGARVLPEHLLGVDGLAHVEDQVQSRCAVGTGVLAADLMACMMLEVTATCCSFMASVTSPLTIRCTWLRIDSCRLRRESGVSKRAVRPTAVSFRHVLL